MPSPNRKRAGVGLALGLDRGEQIVDRLLLPPLAPDQLVAVPVQPENVGGRLQPAELEELDDGLFAQPLDVERAAADEMLQPLDPLRRADQPAGAANIDLAFLGDRFALAFRAMVGEDVGVARLVAGQDSRPPAG